MIKPIETEHDGAWHRAHFAEFALAKVAIGEPMSHFRIVDHLSREADTEERLWRAGLYLNAWSVMTAEAVWSEWPVTAAYGLPDQLALWLRENWPGMHTRKERRCVRTVEKFTKCLNGYLAWMRSDFPALYTLRGQYDNDTEYDMWWNSAQSIPYFGRYICTKMLETMRYWGYTQAQLYDLRAVGAHSPIRCLMLLRPDVLDDLATGAPDIVNKIGSEVLTDLRASGLDISWFVYATLLCEYRVSYEDGTEYPGNSHDEELDYLASRYANHWRGRGFASQILTARAAIDPPECLGETQGWDYVRAVGGYLRSHGVVWNDVVYDYHKSGAAGTPVLR